MYNSSIKEKKGILRCLVFLAKTKLNIINVFVSKALIESYINHEEFVLVNNVLWEYNKAKEKIKSPESAVEFTIEKQWNRILSVVR